MYCQKCGKEIPNDAAFCVECGAPINQAEAMKYVQAGKTAQENNLIVKTVPYNEMCIIGLVVSVISLFVDFWGLVSTVGIVLSVVGLIQCKKKQENGKILAILGIVLGVLEALYLTFA